MKKVVVQKDFDLSTTKQKFVIAIDEALGITSHDDELFAPLVNMLGKLTIKEVKDE